MTSHRPRLHHIHQKRQKRHTINRNVRRSLPDKRHTRNSSSDLLHAPFLAASCRGKRGRTTYRSGLGCCSPLCRLGARHDLAQQSLVLFLHEAALDAHAGVGEVLPDIVLDHLRPHLATSGNIMVKDGSDGSKWQGTAGCTSEGERSLAFAFNDGV